MIVSTKRKLWIGSSMIFFIGCLFILPFASNPAMSFSTAAPPGYCGAPGDGNSNCSSCHVGPPATLISNAIVTDIPASGYIPGATYNVSAKIVGLGHTRFGFQVSPQDVAGNQIGSMNDLGPETSFTGFGKYITHSSTGTVGTDSVTWFFEWVAPPAGTGSFTFYGAFNVTDNSGGNSGDTIYVTSVSYNEDISTSSTNSQNLFSDLKIYSNANRDQISVSFQMLESAQVVISLYDMQGKFLGDLCNDFKANKQFKENLNLPALQSSGIFLLQIRAGNRTHTQKIFLANQ